ncbi:FGGY-family carbohydrate kinase [Cohnella zeiphila]|uniref:FGGY-family carbohydrate kinase n=1 Tax=Cohnella zeiphila TaxID=2761120 RepID=A0A7X0VUY7_9BACL|nr:FGGY-family carbohydrate kinase [Cohnella zeiphila]MBB6730885.1 FGGY-family carbohydrate kinase [Cohnella zeiphila]
MEQSNPLFIGIDIGTQGVRAVALQAPGKVAAARSIPFPQVRREEQPPGEWWTNLADCLRSVTGELRDLGCLHRVRALSVTSTSSTMIPLDQDYEPLHNALMYSDPRSGEEAARCVLAAQRAGIHGYTGFNSSSGLPKILWYARHYPQEAERIRLWAHAADYIVGKLSGVWGVTDVTNAMKTGYDLFAGRWPDYISSELGVPLSWLPEVVASGTALGKLTERAAAETGLPSDVSVAAGMTDGCASQIASGAIRPGDWSTTIGTTLVLKGVTRSFVDDPEGRVYNHRHPEGFWMPGGASNTGADWIPGGIGPERLEQLNRTAESLTPTPWIAYPLQRQGERFPFVSGEARGFDAPGLTPEQQYASRMEGVAYLEKMSYDLLQRLSGERISSIHTAGGASGSRAWLQIRSSVLQMPIRKMKHAEGAVGAAILAASKHSFADLREAGSNLIRPDEVIEPGGASDRERYAENYERFVETLRAKGYLKERGWIS